uniref:Sec61-beta n=1 Tax=Nosema pernyi TaxID=1112939 RepID=A0A0N7ABN6_9MICR|nr:sec61-beta [Nosema pernyi]
MHFTLFFFINFFCMNEAEVLDKLLFCNLCFAPHKKKKVSTLLISYCMHVVCSSCLEDSRLCPVCCSDTSFTPITHTISKKLKSDVSELFTKPIDLAMFQLGASLNLISFLSEELASYKRLLNMAKREIENLRNNNNKSKSNKSYGRIINNKSRDNIPTILNFSNVSTSSVNQRISLPKGYKAYRKHSRK